MYEYITIKYLDYSLIYLLYKIVRTILYILINHFYDLPMCDVPSVVVIYIINIPVMWLIMIKCTKPASSYYSYY